MMKQLPVLMGVLKYEFRMQVRRRAVWITICLLTTLLLSVMSRGQGTYDAITHLDRYPLITTLAQWTYNLNQLLALGVGVLLADRLARDHRYKVDELFDSMPGALSTRLAGKYVGSLLATLAPIFVFYGLGVIYILLQTHNLMAIPLAMATFTAIMLPGLMFVCAFSIACPAIMWVPLYQFLFICYWFWGNDLSPNTGIPTISETILTPVGKYPTQGFFGINNYIHATSLQATESILLLISVAIFVLIALWAYLKWQHSRL